MWVKLAPALFCSSVKVQPCGRATRMPHWKSWLPEILQMPPLSSSVVQLYKRLGGLTFTADTCTCDTTRRRAVRRLLSVSGRIHALGCVHIDHKNSREGLVHLRTRLVWFIKTDNVGGSTSSGDSDQINTSGVSQQNQAGRRSTRSLSNVVLE